MRHALFLSLLLWFRLTRLSKLSSVDDSHHNNNNERWFVDHDDDYRSETPVRRRKVVQLASNSSTNASSNSSSSSLDPCTAPLNDVFVPLNISSNASHQVYRSSFVEHCIGSLAMNARHMQAHIQSLQEVFAQY